MLTVHSQLEPTIRLSIIQFPGFLESRISLTSSDDILQAAAVPLERGTNVQPHSHNSMKRETYGTQEAWVVMHGAIQLAVFDLDNTLVGNWILPTGSMVLYLNGGHGLTALESGTVIYEFKNGPYRGPDVDKTQF